MVVEASPPELFGGVIGPGQADLVAFRYSSYDVPFWVRQNSRSGRWHRSGEPPTQYWSTSPEGAWAELIRAESVRSEEELDELRMPIWICRFPCARLIDLTDPVICEAYSLTQSQLIGDDWTPCQDAAPQLRVDGAGVLTPSAALQGAVNVTVFGPRRSIALESGPKLASAVPAAVVALGRPPRGLVNRVSPRATPLTLF